MSGPTPFSNAQPQYPALYLYALNDSFVPKHIALLNNQHVKIGRQTSAKTVPAERNGYFDSKVLSRQHAEVWEEGGKIFIKDVKSSNGTFINGERLSAEGVESEPYEIKTDDIVEFGIDIVGEDNKTIIHHKVAARAVCILSDVEAQSALRAEHAAPPTGPSSAAFNFTAQQTNGTLGQAPNGQASNFARRPQIQGMGGLGGSMRPPGKSGLTFEHILSRLQGELQKSRETGAELHNLTGAMGDVGETLGGGLPPALPSYPSNLPPVRPPQPQQQQSHQHTQSEPVASASGSSSSDRSQPVALGEIQAQLQETQSSLSSHIEKIRVLEETLAEQAALKSEMHILRELIEDRKRVRPFSPSNAASVRPMSPVTHRNLRDHHDAFDEPSDIDDDARSIASTVMPHELERVDEEDEEAEAEAEAERMRLRMEEQAEEEAEAHRRELGDDGEEEVEEQRRRLGRPRTPEPTGLGMDDEDASDRGRSKAYGRLAGSMSPPSNTMAKVDEHAVRLDALAAQLESALELSRNLQSQHAAAQSTIRELEVKVGTLESLVRESQAQQSAPPSAVPDASETPKEGLAELISEWKKSVEGQWSDVREEWSSERDRLRKARDEWESRLHTVEQGFDGMSKKVEDGLAEMEAKTRALTISQHLGVNGDARGSPSSHGLVTPPSPRSLSAGSTKPRNRRRRGSGRGRSGSREDPEGDSGSGSGSGSMGSVDLSSSEQSYGQPLSVNLTNSPAKGKSRPRSPWGPEGSSTDDDDEETRVGDNDREQDAKKYPTPKSSWTGTESSLNGGTTPGSPASGHHQHPSALTRSTKVDLHNPQVSTALGVLVVGIAAAAVMWRVKPDSMLT